MLNSVKQSLIGNNNNYCIILYVIILNSSKWSSTDAKREKSGYNPMLAGHIQSIKMVKYSLDLINEWKKLAKTLCKMTGQNEKVYRLCFLFSRAFKMTCWLSREIAEIGSCFGMWFGLLNLCPNLTCLCNLLSVRYKEICPDQQSWVGPLNIVSRTWIKGMKLILALLL